MYIYIPKQLDMACCMGFYLSRSPWNNWNRL